MPDYKCQGCGNNTTTAYKCNQCKKILCENCKNTGATECKDKRKGTPRCKGLYQNLP